MTLANYKHNFGQTITTDVEGVGVDRAFLAHINIPAASAVASDAAGIMPLTNLGAAVKAITTELTSSVVPRNVQIDGNVSGITGNVKVTGTNIADVAIEETLALNGTTNVVGAKAFKTITKVDLPVQVHTPAAQTETIEITHAVTAEADGDITMAITAAALGDASPKDVVIAVADTMDDVTKVADAIVDALNEDDDVSAHFVASNEAGIITLTALTPLPNDTTLAFGFTDTDTTGVAAGSSTNGTAGVPYDMVSVGWGDIFGLPYLLYADELVILKLFNKAVDTGTVVNSATAIESNTFDPNGTPDGLKDIDLYILV